MTASRAIGAALIGLGGGLLVGLLVGALLLSSDENSTTSAAVPTRSPRPTRTAEPTATRPPRPAPTETAGWDPCTKPGLCDFLETLDARLTSRDLDGVLDLVEFVPMQCGSPETQLGHGVFPLECRDWPYNEPVPTVGFAQRDSQGVPTSRWAMRDHLDSFVTGRESDCLGETQGIQRRIRVIANPPNPEFYWNGEVALLLGAPLDCVPTIDPESGERFVFNVRPNEAGTWQIESMIEVAFDSCDSPYTRYFNDIRYYPFGSGRPQFTGPQVCLTEETT
jgi:hypothetical protein